MRTLVKILESLGAYLKAQLVNAAVVTAMYVVALAVTGVPWWLAIGLVCGALNVIPHLGSILALGIALFAKWCIADDLLSLAYVMAAWLIIQLIDGFVLSPRAAGRAGLNPFVSILITLGAGLLFGPIGMLLAVPVAILVSIVYRATRRRRVYP